MGHTLAMGESDVSNADGAVSGPPSDSEKPNYGRRFFFFVIGAALLAIAYLVGAAVVPRWWAQRISNVIDGRLLFGNMLGFTVGFVFTLLPMFVLYVGWRFKKSWKRAAGFLIAAFVVAAPNLMTLGIVLGSGDAAHAGERILDVDGPGFRGGSLVGAAAAVVIGLALMWLIGSRRRNKRKAADLQSELSAQS